MTAVLHSTGLNLTAFSGMYISNDACKLGLTILERTSTCAVDPERGNHVAIWLCHELLTVELPLLMIPHIACGCTCNALAMFLG